MKKLYEIWIDESNFGGYARLCEKCMEAETRGTCKETQNFDAFLACEEICECSESIDELLDPVLDEDGGINGEQYRADCPYCSGSLDWTKEGIKCNSCNSFWKE